MSNSDCATIIKRGYLFDKKAGLLDAKKKWFVLRKDSVMGYCILEHFKDEKSWSRREPSKGFINVQEIVEVIRVQDKKQTLELLCPGIGYRLMAYSEADADDWVEAIKKLIVYRKDVRSMSFPRIMPQGNNESSPLSSSPPSMPFTTNSITGPLSHHAALPTPMFSIDGSNFPKLSPQHQNQQPSHQYPTPPETIVDTTNSLTGPVCLQKQNSHDGVNPYPSPPSSIDSASMCGGSSTNSFDSSSINDGNDSIMDSFHRIHSKFRVSVNDSERLNAIGECDLIISEDSMILTNPLNGSQIASWALGAIRRYGINSVCFTFESGRNCSIGEGQFFFYSSQSRLIYKQVHSAISRMNKEPRRSSTPADLLALRTGSSMVIPITRTPSSNESLSPPQYNHIEHQLKQPLSHDLYTKLQQNSPSAISTCSVFTDYEKLTHKPSGTHSNVPILPTRPQPIVQSHSTPEPLYSTLKEVDTGDEEVIVDEGGSTLCDDDVPPPIPPRSGKNVPM